MHLKTLCKRLTALMLAVLMMLTLLPVSVFAEDIDSDMTSHADTDIVSPDTSIADADINDFTTDTSENTEESDDTSAVQEPETETKEEGTDDGMSDALPTGYVGELVVLEGTVTSDVTTVLDATNIPSQSKIRIIKTDSVTGEMLPGAEFFFETNNEAT